MKKDYVIEGLRAEVAHLQAQLAPYKAIINQVLAVVMRAPELEADYSLPPPVEMLPPMDEVHAGRLREWWIAMLEGYPGPDTRPKHSSECRNDGAPSGCWECGMCSSCGRYVGSGE